MNVLELPTPSILVDLDVLRANIRGMADLCKANNKELWPMVKTHKSSVIARMQYEAGAEGFLVGTIEEAEVLASKGFTNIMMAYPVVSPENLKRVIDLTREARVVLTLDSVETASLVNKILNKHGVSMEYLIKVDCGGRRLGVEPEKVTRLAEKLREFTYLKLRGVCTHSGHAYNVRSAEEVRQTAEDEVRALRTAVDLLKDEGYEASVVATGCTPTARYVVRSEVVNVMRPGSYVFYDAMQVALGTTTIENCALTVLATVISRPAPNRLIIDAGSKTLSADRSSRNIPILRGYGIVKEHPELTVTSLSEEVGKIEVEGRTDVGVGDKIEIIPSHACVVANNTSYLVGHRGGEVEAIIPVDARERIKPPISIKPTSYSPEE
ncbi:MAG: alanine racemase [Zestosphaera sp.]